MALAVSLLVLFAVFLFACIITVFGHWLLRCCHVKLDRDADHLLCSAATGVMVIEAALFFVQLTGRIRAGTLFILGTALALGLSDIRHVLKTAATLFKSIAGTRERALAVLTGIVLSLEGLAAMAPVTGSDALHYHFTAPLLVLQNGFHANFFLSHSFFTGQGHLLILAGLALGSDQLALGFLFLGGVLAALGAASLAARWSTREWGWLAALAFLLTPVAFWQMSAAGAPDIWMAFFVVSGVMVISQANKLPAAAGAMLVGGMAGAIAGTKYTGCIVAAALALAYLWEMRSHAKPLLFFVGALGAGIYPYARNMAWTGDPMFPFLLRWISPAKVNAFGLAALLADTGATSHQSLWHLAKFPFFAAIDGSHLGFWQFFGPLIVAFAPLLAFAVRNTPLWRAVLVIWILSAMGIGASSGMLRFLLPIFPIALAATVAAFLVFAFGAFALYARAGLAAATGLTSRKQYLEQHSPEFAAVQFVNRTLQGRGPGKAAVFLRHLFYLRPPYLNCDPASSWATDPAKLQTPEQWLALFREQNVRWVVRGAEYPEAFANPLRELERQERLVPFAHTEVVDFAGLRLSGQRELMPIEILELKP
jgi:hypothetical protein